MVLGSALASTFNLVYAFTFPQLIYNIPLFTLTATVSAIGRIVYTAGFALAVLGVVRAFGVARVPRASTPAAGPNALQATAGAAQAARFPEDPSARVVMLGLAVFIIGFALSIAAQLLPLALLGVIGIQVENVMFAVSGVTSAGGTFLILYGIGTFLVRRS